MVPPVSPVARAVHYLSLQKATATLIVPLWPSSSFWPLLAYKYRTFIKGYFTLNGSQALSRRRNLNYFLGSLVLQARLSSLDSNFCRDWPTFGPSSRFLN